MSVRFLTPVEVSNEYGIPLRTVYKRVKNYVYRTDGNGKILADDVEKVIANPVKTGRPRKI